jgi:hypothetical protein
MSRKRKRTRRMIETEKKQKALGRRIGKGIAMTYSGRAEMKEGVRSRIAIRC